MDPLFPQLPEDFAGLTSEDLDALLADHLRIVDAVEAGDEDVIGDRDTAKLITELTTGVEQIEQVRGEIEGRATQAAADQTALEDVFAAARAAAGNADEPVAEGDPEDTPAADSDPEDTEAETPAVEAETPADAPAETPEADAPADVKQVLPVAASAKPAPRVPARHQPRRKAPTGPTVERPLVAITAASDLAGLPSGTPMSSMRDVAVAMQRKHDSLRRAPLNGDRVSIATITASYAEDRILRPGEDKANGEKLDAATSPQAITASGGICVPGTPQYDLLDISTSARPVRDALPSFNAVRGGIRFSLPGTIADIDDAIGIITATADGLGGTNAQKSCQVIDCSDFEDVDVDAIFHCLQFGNLPARTWPEQVQHFMSLTVSAQARLAEGNLLDQIDAASTAVTDAVNVTNIGMVADFFPSVIKAAAAYRSRHRMDPNASLRVMIPAWARDMAVADLMRSAFYMEDAAVSFLNDKLALANVRATYYLDTNAGGGQVFGAQSAGALLDFPSNIVWYLFSEGSFVYLDGGELELGLVRDSTLNSTNDYQVFGENWENLAFKGVESLKVTTVAADTGRFGNGVDIVAAG